MSAEGRNASADTLASLRDLLEEEGITCMLCDSMGRTNAMTAEVRPLWEGARFAGPTVTARTLGTDLSAVFEAIDACQPGDVLVISTHGIRTSAFWGENTTLSALNRGIAAVVIDGPCRDVGAVRRLRFPVFATGATPNAGLPGGKGWVNVPIQCGGVVVQPGDILVGDENGVVVIPVSELSDVSVQTHDALERERETQARLKTGATIAELRSRGDTP